MGLEDLDANENEDLALTDEDDTVLKIQRKLEHLVQIYNSGRPLFPRSLLADLARQIDQGNDEVHIDDLDGVPHKHSLKVPAWCTDVATTYRIAYNSIQILTCIHPAFPDMSLGETSPVSICYMRIPEHAIHPVDEVQKIFNATQAVWRASETCQALTAHLLSVPIPETVRITKIVAFGLGTLSSLAEREKTEKDREKEKEKRKERDGGGYGYHTTRAHAQHAAIGSIAETLKGRGVGGGEEIKCYAQDPAYNAVDCEVLRGLGVTPLDDPKGFLEIDESTLVFSVSPNVPVKQIVADVQWPAAMIWNTVGPAEKERGRWEKKTKKGEEYWVVPFSTDPDSRRVRKMVGEYTSVPLRDSNEYFGDLTIYVRKK